MGNYQNGVTDKRLTQAELHLANYAQIRDDQLSVSNWDINEQLYHLQKEYDDFYEEKTMD